VVALHAFMGMNVIFWNFNNSGHSILTLRYVVYLPLWFLCPIVQLQWWSLEYRPTHCKTYWLRKNCYILTLNDVIENFSAQFLSTTLLQVHYCCYWTFNIGHTEQAVI
jgi:hypothetical protein